MQALTQALHAKLAGDPDVIAWAAAYGGGPAVFTGDAVPANAVLPFVHVHPASSDTDRSTLRRRGREIIQDISLHQEFGGNASAISRTAEKVRDLLHYQPLTVPGWEVVFMIASGPIGMSEEAGYLGRSVSIRTMLQEA